MKRFAMFAVVMMAVAAAPSVSSALSPAQGVAAMRKLSFMKGTWRCVLHGGPSDGFSDVLTYSFSPDYRWMVEQERGAPGQSSVWSVQMWGYNAREQKLRAYQFTSRGMFTKTASGWRAGVFESRSDYNGLLVSIRKRSPNAFDWVIRFPNDSQTAIQACRK